MSSAALMPGLTPGSNVSGWNVSVPFGPQQGGQASLGGNINPFLPTSQGTGTSLPSMPQGAVSNSATSGFPANTGAYSGVNLPGIGTSGGTFKGYPYGGGGGPLTMGENQTGFNSLQDNLSKVYGRGIGDALTQFLASGAGYNPSSVQALLAQQQPGINQGLQQLMQQFSSTGNRFSSGSQLGTADYLSQVNLNQGAMEAQMYQQAIQNYLDVLMGAAPQAAKWNQSKPGLGDILGSVFGGITSGAGGLSSLISAISPNASTGILDAIAGLAL